MADTMTIYQYDEYGYWTGESVTQSVMSPIPARWTDVAPPALADGEYAVFDNTQWIIVTQLPVIVLDFPVEAVAAPVISEAPTVM